MVAASTITVMVLFGHMIIHPSTEFDEIPTKNPFIEEFFMSDSSRVDLLENEDRLLLLLRHLFNPRFMMMISPLQISP